MSYFITHDGTALVTDPDLGVVSAPSVSEALVEIQRRKSFIFHVLPGGRDCNRVCSVFSPRAVQPLRRRGFDHGGGGIGDVRKGYREIRNV